MMYKKYENALKKCLVTIGVIMLLPIMHAYGWEIVYDKPKTSPYNHTAQEYGGNKGVIEAYRLGHITPNSGGPRYNYVVVFELKRHNEHYRAMADLENFVLRSDDTMYALGYIGNGIILASLDTDNPYSAIATKYSRASHLTRVCKVYERGMWDISDLVNDIIFERKPPRSLCR